MQILLAALFMWLHCPESFVVKSHFKIRPKLKMEADWSSFIPLGCAIAGNLVLIAGSTYFLKQEEKNMNENTIKNGEIMRIEEEAFRKKFDVLFNTSLAARLEREKKAKDQLLK